MDLYRVLGVARTATAAELKAAYRQRAREVHPDRRPGDEQAAEEMKLLNLAYAILSDPDKRALYDAGAQAPPFSIELGEAREILGRCGNEMIEFLSQKGRQKAQAAVGRFARPTGRMGRVFDELEAAAKEGAQAKLAELLRRLS